MKKVVLITGASGDIGSAIARKFADDGYSIAIHYNNSEESAKSLATEICENGSTVLCYKADISKGSDCENMINKIIKDLGHIDVLINNAGISDYNILIDDTFDNINKVVSTNLIGTINCTKLVSENMIKNNYGKIINMSSIWGICGASGESVYSATKGAIIAFTKSMAKELAYNNITVNCIAPGVVETKMIGHLSNDEKNNLMQQIPLNRFASTQEIANLALFLASNNANYITGQTIQIDGGFNL